jgi:hypothetical protein
VSVAAISQKKVRAYLDLIENGATSAAKGKAAEDLLAYIFERVPGVRVSGRNTLDAAGAEEVDIVLWNDRRPNGLPFLPNTILVECKAWNAPVTNQDVSYFATKVEERFQTHAFLYAANGITGNPQLLKGANDTISRALAYGRHIMVITRAEIEQLRTTVDFVRLVQAKLCYLVQHRTSINVG